MPKYVKFLIPVLFTLAIALGLSQRGENRYAVNNRSGEIKFSPDAQKELWAFYQKAQDFRGRENPAIDKSTITFLAVGDIMLSRNVAAKIKTAGDPLLPFRPLSPLFQSVDFSFGNLESPFSGKNTFNPTGSMIFNTPRDNIKGLVENKFKILNLASNHALDQGMEGLEYTIKYLDENNIKHIGAGMTMDEAWKPAVIEQDNIKTCFIGASYASVNDGGKNLNEYVARIEDIEKLKAISYKLKAACDFIAVSMHAGTEYTRKPNQAQINFAHAAIDYGADIVIGHHPHWIQEIEKYCPNDPSSPGEEKMSDLSSEASAKGEGQMRSNCSNPKYIFYSLGNFIFDQMWSQETREGLALKIRISKSEIRNELQESRIPATLESIELLPIIIDNYSTPRLADETESKKILEKIDISETILR